MPLCNLENINCPTFKSSNEYLNQKNKIENPNKESNAFYSSITENISEQASLKGNNINTTEAEFNFDNLRLKQIMNTKDKSSAPKLLGSKNVKKSKNHT